MIFLNFVFKLSICFAAVDNFKFIDVTCTALHMANVHLSRL